MIDRQGMIDSRVVSCRAVLGIPWHWERVVVGADGSSSGHPTGKVTMQPPTKTHQHGVSGTHQSPGGGGKPELPPVLLHGAPAGPGPTAPTGGEG